MTEGPRLSRPHAALQELHEAAVPVARDLWGSVKGRSDFSKFAMCLYVIVRLYVMYGRCYVMYGGWGGDRPRGSTRPHTPAAGPCRRRRCLGADFRVIHIYAAWYILCGESLMK
jgi:hypothetical protein